MKPIEAFFEDIDHAWMTHPAAKIDLRLIGCGALMLQASYERGTKDSDVFETTSLTTALKAELLRIAGKDTALHARHRMYVDIVPNGVPFLPAPPRWHPLTGLNTRLRRLEIHVLDVIDIVVSKLKRFHGNDRSDIDAMIQLGLVPHAQLVERFQSAEFTFDARAVQLPAYVENFNQVERDMPLAATGSSACGSIATSRWAS